MIFDWIKVFIALASPESSIRDMNKVWNGVVVLDCQSRNGLTKYRVNGRPYGDLSLRRM